MKFVHILSTLFRVVWNERAVLIPTVLIILLLMLSLRHINRALLHLKFCISLKHLCKRNGYRYRSDFFRTLLHRKAFLGYTVRIRGASGEIPILFFPYNAHRRVVHLFNNWKNVLIYRETFQVKPGLGRGESEGVFRLNPTEHAHRQRRLLLCTDREPHALLVFTSKPTRIFLTRNGIRESIGSGYRAEGITVYEADDLICYLKRHGA